MWIMEINTHCQYLRPSTTELSYDRLFIVDCFQQRGVWPPNQPHRDASDHWAKLRHMLVTETDAYITDSL